MKRELLKRKILKVICRKKYYSGPDDPEYVVIEVKPQIIEYMDSETHKPIIYKTRQFIDEVRYIKYIENT